MKRYETINEYEKVPVTKVFLGKVAENQAVRFLKKKKYKMLERNYKNTFGEIDIIAKDKETIVFVEVKGRTNLKYGEPKEAVDKYKQQRILKASIVYLKNLDLLGKSIRYDVIEIKNDGITHYENAFSYQ